MLAITPHSSLLTPRALVTSFGRSPLSHSIASLGGVTAIFHAGMSTAARNGTA
jgi:hypothetical protein